MPVGKNGDTYDRYWIRVQELYESVKIIRQCLEQMQEGPIMADVPSVTLAAEATSLYESGSP